MAPRCGGASQDRGRAVSGGVDPRQSRPPVRGAADARLVPVDDLPAAAGSGSSYAVLGSGKTAADACVWLPDNGVEPDRIRWIGPRDAWFYDRLHFQPLEQVGAIIEGISLDAEAGAQADSLEDLFQRLEASGRLVRIDPACPATMYRGTMLSARGLEALRRITDVVRLGRVRRIEAGRIVLERGEVDTGAGVVPVDCSALGLNNSPVMPIFQAGRIVLQQVRDLDPGVRGVVGDRCEPALLRRDASDPLPERAFGSSRSSVSPIRVQSRRLPAFSRATTARTIGPRCRSKMSGSSTSSR
jgi:hypothetical protein